MLARRSSSWPSWLPSLCGRLTALVGPPSEWPPRLQTSAVARPESPGQRSTEARCWPARAMTLESHDASMTGRVDGGPSWRRSWSWAGESCGGARRSARFPRGRGPRGWTQRGRPRQTPDRSQLLRRSFGPLRHARKPQGPARGGADGAVSLTALAADCHVAVAGCGKLVGATNSSDRAQLKLVCGRSVKDVRCVQLLSPDEGPAQSPHVPPRSSPHRQAGWSAHSPPPKSAGLGRVDTRRTY